MNTYRLNEKHSPIAWSMGFTGCERDVVVKKNGDPFLGEALTLPWEAVRDGEIEIKVTLEESSFIDCVVIKTSEKTALRYARLSAFGVLLDEHCAETGKAVTSHVLELKAGISAEELILSFCCDFSELSLLSVDIYGSEGEKVDLFPIPKEICFGAGDISVTAFNTYTAEGDAEAAGLILCEKLFERAGG